MKTSKQHVKTLMRHYEGVGWTPVYCLTKATPSHQSHKSFDLVGFRRGIRNQYEFMFLKLALALGRTTKPEEILDQWCDFICSTTTNRKQGLHWKVSSVMLGTRDERRKVARLVSRARWENSIYLFVIPTRIPKTFYPIVNDRICRSLNLSIVHLSQGAYPKLIAGVDASGCAELR
jgi:hypothetical protein